MERVLLSVKDFSKSVARRDILESVSFEIKASQNTAFVGPNGAGKTLLLRSLFGVDREWCGEVLIDGLDIRELSAAELSTLVGYVPQRLEYLPPFRVTEFYEACAFSPHMKKNIPSVIELVGIKKHASSYLSHLSGGELQRCLIGSGLISQPKLLVLDEPTTHLDAKYRQQIFRILKEISDQRQCTIMMVSHEVDFLRELCKQVVAIKNKRVWRIVESKDFSARLHAELFDLEYDKKDCT